MGCGGTGVLTDPAHSDERGLAALSFDYFDRLKGDRRDSDRMNGRINLSGESGRRSRDAAGRSVALNDFLQEIGLGFVKLSGFEGAGKFDFVSRTNPNRAGVAAPSQGGLGWCDVGSEVKDKPILHPGFKSGDHRSVTGEIDFSLDGVAIPGDPVAQPGIEVVQGVSTSKEAE
ncbi:MAG: hypothetical protein AAF514_08710 [Verrucomicrobiota bacterium]